MRKSATAKGFYKFVCENNSLSESELYDKAVKEFTFTSGTTAHSLYDLIRTTRDAIVGG